MVISGRYSSQKETEVVIWPHTLKHNPMWFYKINKWRLHVTWIDQPSQLWCSVMKIFYDRPTITLPWDITSAEVDQSTQAVQCSVTWTAIFPPIPPPWSPRRPASPDRTLSRSPSTWPGQSAPAPHRRCLPLGNCVPVSLLVCLCFSTPASGRQCLMACST